MAVNSIVPNLWFDTESEEAARYYCGIFPNSSIDAITHYTDVGPREKGMVLTVDFTLDGTRFTAINGGPDFPFTEAVSFLVECEDQAEVDRYWDALGAGGEHGPCGWLKDKYGLSWQVCPKGMLDMITSDDEAAKDRAMTAMMKMSKLDLAELQRAFADA